MDLYNLMKDFMLCLQLFLSCTSHWREDGEPRVLFPSHFHMHFLMPAFEPTWSYHCLHRELIPCELIFSCFNLASLQLCQLIETTKLNQNEECGIALASPISCTRNTVQRQKQSYWSLGSNLNRPLFYSVPLQITSF